MRSNLEARVGRFVAAMDRMADYLREAAQEAIDHGISVREVVACLQEVWDNELHDRRKQDATQFNELLKKQP